MKLNRVVIDFRETDQGQIVDKCNDCFFGCGERFMHCIDQGFRCYEKVEEGTYISYIYKEDKDGEYDYNPS